MKHLTPKNIAIGKLYFDDHLNTQQIADKFHITRQAVNLHTIKYADMNGISRTTNTKVLVRCYICGVNKIEIFTEFKRMINCVHGDKERMILRKHKQTICPDCISKSLIRCLRCGKIGVHPDPTFYPIYQSGLRDDAISRFYICKSCNDKALMSYKTRCPDAYRASSKKARLKMYAKYGGKMNYIKSLGYVKDEHGRWGKP